MKFRLKTIIVKTLRTMLKAACILPVKRRKILFSAYEGQSYGCNPKYIFESLYDLHPELDFVWVLNDATKLPEQYRGKVKTVRFLSPAHIRHLLTSKVIVSNLGIEPFVPKRRNQTFINTWHGGGAYKRVVFDMGNVSEEQKKYTSTMRDLRSASTDLFLSSCSRFSEVSARDFDIEIDKFIDTGMPRNDRLINKDEERTGRLREEICRSRGLDPDALLVLYAPTFRGTFRQQRDLDLQVCCRQVADAFSTRFGKKVNFLFRSHVSKEAPMTDFGQADINISDFTNYPDMQELLEVCDILITDYSSSIWDFALTGKPAFLFMPDLQDYLKERDFYTPLDRWPFPYATDVESFCTIIGSHNDKDNENRIKKHLSLLGSYEHGNASLNAVRIIDMVIRN
ncbi:MAG: hypothetical protein HDS82_02205 [Bacteroidales bacterium]|nr:hypothetical protein [Bacteroidales bacterium]